MNRQEMIQQVKKQLAIDLNCVVTDFDQPGICFCPAFGSAWPKAVSAKKSSF